MNIVLLEPKDTAQAEWRIHSARQLSHLHKQLNIQVDDTLKVGIRNGKRYLTRIVAIEEQEIRVTPIQQEACPAKLPVTLIVAMPRPKVLRRLIMDSVTLGVERICLTHSYRVDKSYWQTPFCSSSTTILRWGLSKLATRSCLISSFTSVLSRLWKMCCQV